MKGRTKMKTKTAELTKRTVESALMIAFATVLSVLKLVDMPYGGSVTLASMLPIAMIAYRHGTAWGFITGGAYAVVQQLLGLENFSYLPVPTWQAMLALCVLDYALAFAAIGLGGIFRGRLRRGGANAASAQARELALGVALVSVIRYLMHTVAGFTVWAGLAIPDAAALWYSVGYNATYMIPETLVNVTVALYIGSLIDLTRRVPGVFTDAQRGIVGAEPRVRGIVRRLLALLIAAAIVADAKLIFKHVQDPETGELTLAYLSEVNWIAVVVLSAACAVAAVAIFVYLKRSAPKSEG